MSKLVIIDGHAVMYRAFHAMPPLSTPKGEPINAVHGFVSMILKLVVDLAPTAIAVAFDEKVPTFRNKALPTYQAQRPPMPSDLSGQFAKAKKFLEAAKIPYYSKPGYEADDVIGTIATEAVRLQSTDYSNNKKTVVSSLLAVESVIIVTGDRDQLQLVNDKLGIKLYMPIAGLMNAKLFGEAETLERMGVPASQIVDLKSLTGDASDNYFGVPGIGPKTAISLLSKYETLENIYKHLDEVSVRVREKLEAGKDSADQSYMLATIVCDVPLKIDFPQMEKWNLFSSEVIKLFEESFGFRTLTERIKKLGKQAEEEKQAALF